MRRDELKKWIVNTTRTHAICASFAYNVSILLLRFGLQTSLDSSLH